MAQEVLAGVSPWLADSGSETAATAPEPVGTR